MFKKEYNLEQHSILIHFQANHEADGKNVCLRASEVKPKLDRFLEKKLGGREKVIEDHKDWIRALHINGVDVSFNYRMIIKSANQNVTIYGGNNSAYPLPAIFYGNMNRDGENNGDEKYGVFFNKGLQLSIICSNNNLGETIDQYIAVFFAVTNFGTMQDKGFGSFTIRNSNVKISEALKDNYGAEKCYVVKIRHNIDPDKVQKELFDTIKQIYSVMKSGSRKPFEHSYIYQYMHSQHIGNEKAKMKIDKLSPALGRKGMGAEPQYKYIRAVLGLGSKIEYITDNPNPDWYELDAHGSIIFQSNGTPKTKFLNRSGRYTVKKVMKEKIEIEHVLDAKGTRFKKDSDDMIKRMASPIFFKIMGNYIYIVARRINESIFGKYFTFQNNTTKGAGNAGLRYRRCKKNPIVLQIPDSFDIDDFIKSFASFYNTTYLDLNPRPNYNYRIEEAE